MFVRNATNEVLRDDYVEDAIRASAVELRFGKAGLMNV